MTIEGKDQAISRRRFVEVGTGLSFLVMLDAGCQGKTRSKAGVGAQAGVDTSESMLDRERTAFGAWVRINVDDSIVIYNPAAEMGQGSMTALPLILAEEMDADWAKVRIEDSPVDVETYGRSWGRGGPGTMLTVGSYAVRGYFTKLRIAGAQIRRALLQVAAQNWNVPVDELSTGPNVVLHAKSKRKISYGELAAATDAPLGLPEVGEADLKSPTDFRLIGTDVPRRDVPSKTNGLAEFAIDVTLPGMLYGAMVRSPVHSGRVSSHNEAQVRALAGVTATVALDHGVGVVGDSIEAVLAAKNKLKVEWKNEEAAEKFDSEAALANYPAIASSKGARVESIASKGDGRAGLARGTKQYKADFFTDYAYHAQMEPLNAVVSINDAGDAQVWVGTQGPGGAQSGVAEALGIQPDHVTIHRRYLGGGYGRRSKADYVVEAAQLSKAVKRPVKFLWTRQDDLQYGMFRPMNLQRLEAGVDAKGNVTAWSHCVVGEGSRLLTSGIEIPFYGIPHQNIELRPVSHGIRLKHWRSVGHAFNKYAIEAFLDEIASAQSVDPLELRRGLMRESPRALRVLETVARMADWGGKASSGRAKGIAVAERSGSVAGAVAEVSVDRSGKIRVHRYWCAVDAGIIIQPANARAQIEGGIVMGLSSALKERVTFKNGRVVQSNYHDYSILRMSEAPEIEVALIESSEPPTGIGEVGGPPTAAAVANAFAALTGKRLRHMPFTRERVSEVLRS